MGAAPAGEALTCAIVSLLPGRSATATIRVTPTAAGPVTNSVTASSTSTDASTANNSAPAKVDVARAPATNPS